MAEIINLRNHRKQKVRRDKEAVAEQNRITFGRTKADKKEQKALQELAERAHDSHKLERDE